MKDEKGISMSKNLDFPIAVAQMRCDPGNVRKNVNRVLAYMAKARSVGMKVIVFPELCTSGYMLGDRWEDESFIREIVEANETIRTASTGMLVIWGSVRADFDRIGEDGRVRKYNAALIAHDGSWISNGTLRGWVPKTNLPKYRIFDDARHFYPADKLAAEMGYPLEELVRPFEVNIDGRPITLALPICEDLWEDEYNTKPSRMYAHYSPDLVVDISHSPWTAGKWQARDKMLRRRAIDSGAPILYVNAVGLQNNAKNLIWFDGGSCLMGADGSMRWMGLLNREDLSMIHPSLLMEEPRLFEHPSGICEKHDATIAAMRDFYASYKRVVIGLSGGIDSAVSLAMHVEALGKDRVLTVNMPTRFNSQTTRSLAKQCARNFGVEYKVVPIEDLFEAELRTYAATGDENPSQFDRENMQARLRGHVLAAQAAMQATKLGGRSGFTCNGNKTEVALNYFTLYGDGAGCSAFFADYWKGEMYSLARLINERAGSDVIPEGVIDIVPSAELSADQNVDEGKGDPIFYPFHDHLLKAFIEKRHDPTVVMEQMLRGTLESDLGCEPGVIAKYFPTRKSFMESLEWAWLQYSYEGKRHMLPPGLGTSRRFFGFDRRDTIADGYFTDAYNALRKKYLAQSA